MAGSQLHLGNRKTNRCSPCLLSDHRAVQGRLRAQRIMVPNGKEQREAVLRNSGSLDRGNQPCSGGEARAGFRGMMVSVDPEG